MKKGFTLVELIVVIAIIGFLAAVIAPNVFRAIEKGRVAAGEADFRAIKTGSTSYFGDTGVWPDDGDEADFTIDDGNDVGWDGPYLDNWPSTNPWNGNYTWEDDSGYNWDGVAGLDPARYITISSVPTTSARRIDRDLDDGTGTDDTGRTTGTVLYDAPAAGVTTMQLLISR